MEWQIIAAEFQRFGDVWIRTDKIAAVDFGSYRDSSRVYIHLVANDGLVLTDEAADVFKIWWEAQAMGTEEKVI